jgi:putative sterol carrier protein
MDLEEIAEKMRVKLSEAPKIEAMVLFDFEDDGTILYNGTVDPSTAKVGDLGDAKTTFRCSLETFKGFMTGTKSPDLAYMMGQLKIEGSLGLAMKLKERLEG